MTREHPGCPPGRGVPLFLVGWLRLTRKTCILQRGCLPTGSPPLFRDLFLLRVATVATMLVWSDAKRYEIGAGLGLSRLVFI